jgi:hypothetical protein
VVRRKDVILREIAARGAVSGVGRVYEDRLFLVMQSVTAILGSNSTIDLIFCQVPEG